MEGLDAAIRAAVKDWEECNFYSSEQINTYIDHHEMALVSFGGFYRGMRIKPVQSDRLEVDFHFTLNGMRGVISLSVHRLRQKVVKN